MDRLTVKDVDLSGKRALVRVDYNVPMKDGVISDLTRIEESLPTINELLRQNAAVILLSHVGRPKGEVNSKYSLKRVVAPLEKLLGKSVKFVDDCIGDEAKSVCANIKLGEVVLLENVRFYKGEEKCEEEFTKQLASLGDVFVNDGFSAAHRSHSSTAGLANYLPAYSGLLMEKEVDSLNKVLNNPQRPLAAIIGGAKVSDKIKVMDSLFPIVDNLLIGGGMANTFLAALGYDMAKSLVEADKIDLAKSIIARAKDQEGKLLLPVDLVVADEFSNDAKIDIVDVDKVPEGYMALDIGPKTIEMYQKALQNAKTIMWNGPMGVFEMPNFANGTKEVARGVASSSGYSVVGGGDSVSALSVVGMKSEIDHVSTGGGAALEFLEGKVLPGVGCLLKK